MPLLSYQSAGETCWVTCMVNGIRFVKKEPRISTAAYRLLHHPLRDYGVEYDSTFEAVLTGVRSLTGLKFTCSRGNDVAPTIEALHFKRQVAVCDIGSGDHSILLTGRHKDWFSAFDPWWYERGRRDIRRRLRFPEDESSTNVKIHREHLLGERRGKGYGEGMAYQMGKIGSRCLTVIERLNKHRRG